MVLKLFRFLRRHDGVQGMLLKEGDFWMFTVENPWMGNQRKISCIPAEKYRLKLRKEDTPLTLHYRERYDFFEHHIELDDVPGRDSIYIHIGNTEKDVDGCIAVGRSAMQYPIPLVGNSTDAFKELYTTLLPLLKTGEPVTIEIVNL